MVMVIAMVNWAMTTLAAAAAAAAAAIEACFPSLVRVTPRRWHRAVWEDRYPRPHRRRRDEVRRRKYSPYRRCRRRFRRPICTCLAMEMTMQLETKSEVEMEVELEVELVQADASTAFADRACSPSTARTHPCTSLPLYHRSLARTRTRISTHHRHPHPHPHPSTINTHPLLRPPHRPRFTPTRGWPHRHCARAPLRPPVRRPLRN